MRKSTSRQHDSRTTQHGDRSRGSSDRHSAAMGDTEGDAAGKLFIGGVSWQTTEAGLREHFGKFGELTDVALMRNKHTGQPRGFGFVKFKDSTGADKVCAVERHVLDGRTVDVKRAVPREATDSLPAPSSSSGSSSTTTTTSSSSSSGLGSSSRSGSTTSSSGSGASRLGTSALVRSSSAPSTTNGTSSLVPASGSAAAAVVSRRSDGEQSLTAAQAAAMPASSTNSNSSNARSSTNHAAASAAILPEQARKVFVGGLAPSVTDAEFRAHFAQFGAIVEAMVMFDRQTQRSRGFGFVTYQDIGSIDKVFESTEAHALRGKIVEVKRAEPKEATAARNALAAQQTATAASLAAPPMMMMPAVQPPYVHGMPPLPPLPVGYPQHDGSTLLIHPPTAGHPQKHAKDKSDNASHPNKAKPSSSSSSSPETNYDVDEGLAHAYGALSLQESMPVPGVPGAAMPYGYTHGGHYDAAQGAYVMTQHGLFVPQVPAHYPPEAAVYAPGQSNSNAPPGFAFARMPPAYYAYQASIMEAAHGNGNHADAAPYFDYTRAWYAGDFSMDAAFNQTGYGGYRGQAATHGRLSRKYRPY